MKMNLTKIMMILMTIVSTIMLMTSNNIMFSWMSMEINFIAFMPLMSKSKKINDQTMKYLIIQSTSSSMMILSILISSITETMLSSSMILMTSMMMKTGMMPFHLWMPSLMMSLSWNSCLWLTTWQKIAPTILMSQILELKLIAPMMCISLMFSPMVGIKQTSTKKMMAYSSISNSSWMISATKISKFQSLYFFMTYFILMTCMTSSMKKNNLMFTNQIKFLSNPQKINILLTMLSISGMPPLLGFFPKWMILQSVLEKSMILPTMMILSSMMSTFMYMKLLYPTMTKMFTNKKTNLKSTETIKYIAINMSGIMAVMILKLN